MEPVEYKTGPRDGKIRIYCEGYMIAGPFQDRLAADKWLDKNGCDERQAFRRRRRLAE